METIGKFEFNRKDLIGHGAFAVVFKGRHKWKHDLEVAVKCINKKNLAKSQSLLGKEIQILKELKHENIVGLLDFQEMGGCVYLVMEYCNGGDLAEYLNSKGTLSEDTIRVFLQQIAGAMKVLQGKGILHRDLKPQNILLCHPEGRKSSPNNTCIKIADFGFARHLQTNTMAATLCGSPMYMAPEVIMSQNYDAKADLWSIGTILYQCLTGKAPFQASTPQELRLFYEVNRSLLPSIPRETSSQLRHLLLGLLQRNHRDRMDFDEFFHHPFLGSSSSAKKSSPVPIPSYPSSGSGSSYSSSSTSHMASPQHSDAEMQRLQAKAQPSPLKDATIHNSRNTSSDTEDFVIVPAEFPSDITCEIGDGSPIQGSMLYSGSSLLVAAGGLENLGRTPPPSPSPRCPPNPVRPAEFSGSNYSQSVPIPVPTQIHNYQRMEQKLHPVGLHGSTRATLCCVGSGGSGGSPGCKKTGFSPPHPSSPGAAFSSHRLSAGGARPYQPSPQVGTIPETPEQTGPLSTRTEQLAGCPGMEHTPTCPQMIQRRNLGFTPPGSQSPQAMPPFEFPQPPSSQNLGPTRTRTMPDLKVLGLLPGTQPNIINRAAGKRKGSFKRSLSAGRLSDILLKAAFGAQLLDGGSNESLNTEKPMDTTAPPGGALRVAGGSASPTAVFFTVGSPSSRNTPPYTTHNRMSSAEGSPSSAWSHCGRLVSRGVQRESDSTHKQQLTDPPAALPDGTVAFDPPEFPEETLMEQGHMDALSNLRFTLAFAHCIMEIACSKDTGFEANDAPDVSFLQQSLVADQISLLSREWSYAEQLVLYMKAAEFLSSTLHAAIEGIRQGRLSPTPTVKQVVRKMNELYKSSVTSCRSLNARLHNFLLNKQRLMDQINSMTAEKLLYSHTVNMVQSAALDEMFHQGQASIQSYHKALLLMEGLSLIITEQADIDNISKCKQWIERRLQTVQST